MITGLKISPSYLMLCQEERTFLPFFLYFTLEIFWLVCIRKPSFFLKQSFLAYTDAGEQGKQ